MFTPNSEISIFLHWNNWTIFSSKGNIKWRGLMFPIPSSIRIRMANKIYSSGKKVWRCRYTTSQRGTHLLLIWLKRSLSIKDKAGHTKRYNIYSSQTIFLITLPSTRSTSRTFILELSATTISILKMSCNNSRLRLYKRNDQHSKVTIRWFRQIPAYDCSTDHHRQQNQKDQILLRIQIHVDKVSTCRA